jgi:acid stress-induced BolA-like protein IbaG/YrbA
MEMKDKIRAAFQNGAGGPKIRVHNIKSVSGRWVVYASSPAFAGKSALERQQLVRALLAGSGSPLTPNERKAVALVCTFTPAEIDGFKKSRLARKRKSGPTA